jgi:hypothetical protein
VRNIQPALTLISPNQYRTPDLIQGKVLAALPWEGGCKIEAVARYTGLDEDTARRALENLIKRRMVTIDDCGRAAGIGSAGALALTPVGVRRCGQRSGVRTPARG